MEKAYDVKELVEGLKGKGLDLAEEAVKIVVDELFVWLENSAKISATPYDDFAVMVYPQVKKLILEKADKLDGQVG